MSTLAASGVTGSSSNNTARKDPSTTTTSTTKKGGYTQLNLQPYKRQDAKPYNKSGHGMQSLGKVVATSRRMPNPASLPSLRSEHAGNDPSVELVPSGGAGWKNNRDGKENTDENVSSEEQPTKEPEIVVAKNKERSPPPPQRSPGKKFKADFPSLEEQESMTKKELEELHRRQREEGGDSSDRHIPDNKSNERSWRDHDVGAHGMRGPPPPVPYNQGGPFPPPGPYHPPYMMQHPPHRHSVHHYPGGPPPMHGPGGNRGGHFPPPPMHFRPQFPPHNYPPANPYEMPDLPRPPTVKADELKSMEMGDEEEGGWAGHHEEVDYTKEVVFSDSSDDETPPLDDENKAKRKNENSNIAINNKKPTRDVPHTDKDKIPSDYPPPMKRHPSSDHHHHRRDGHKHRGADERERPDPQQHGAVPAYSYPPYSYPQYGYHHHPMYSGPPQGPFPIHPHGSGYPPNQRLVGGHSRGGRRNYGDRDEYHSHWGHDSRQHHRSGRKKSTEDDRPRIMSKHDDKKPSKGNVLEKTASSPVEGPVTKSPTSVSPEIPHGHHVSFADEVEEDDSNSDLTSSTATTHVPTRRSQQPKIMLRKMVDKDGDMSSDKPESGGRERPRDLKSLKTMDDDSEETGDRVKPTAWSMKERGPIVSPKTLYEPEGKHSAAKFKKYQAQARETKGKTSTDGAESAPATTSGDAKVSPTENKSLRPFSPAADKKPEQRKGHTERTRRIEPISGEQHHHPERQDSGHDRSKPHHRKEDSRRENDGDIKMHSDSKSSDFDRDACQQGLGSSRNLNEDCKSPGYHEQVEVSDQPGNQYSSDNVVDEKEHLKVDKQQALNSTVGKKLDADELSMNPDLLETSSGPRRSDKQDVKTFEKSNRWYEHKSTLHDTRADTSDRSRHQSDRRGHGPQQRRDGKHSSRDDPKGRDRSKHQSGKDERKADPKRWQDKTDRNRPPQTRGKDGGKQETWSSGRSSTELKKKRTNVPHSAFGYKEVVDIESESDWENENENNLEQKIDSGDSHLQQESRGKPVRGRNEHRQSRDDHRQSRDDPRQSRDDPRQSRDDHRQSRDNHRQLRDNHRQSRDDHKQDHRQPRDNHRQSRDDRKPLRRHKEDRRGGREDNRGVGRGRGGKWEESQERTRPGQRCSQQTDSSSKEDSKRAEKKFECDISELEPQGLKESGLPKTDFTKYDLNSNKIAIVDDIGEHDLEEGRHSPSGFVEVTSKKAQKEKQRKEKEEKRKLAEDQKKEDDRKKRRQTASKPPLGATVPSANKPFTAWNANSTDADLWSNNSDLHSTLPAVSAAPGSHLKPNIPGGLEIGFIGDSLPQSKANVPHTAELVSSTSTSSVPVEMSDKSYTLFDGHRLVGSLFTSSLDAAVESTVPNTNTVSTVPLSNDNVAAKDTEHHPPSQTTLTKPKLNEKEFHDLPPSRGRGGSKNLPPRLKTDGSSRGRSDKGVVGDDRREKRGRSSGGKNELPRNQRTEASHRTNSAQRNRVSETQGNKLSQQSVSSDKNKERFYVHPRAREPSKGHKSSGEKTVQPGESKVAKSNQSTSCKPPSAKPTKTYSNSSGSKKVENS